jgi:hypothetical protein
MSQAGPHSMAKRCGGLQQNFLRSQNSTELSGDAKDSPADSAGRLRGYAAVKHGAFWKHQLIRFAVESRI